MSPSPLPTTAAPATPPPARASLLKQPNVAWLMAGSAMSLVGDQFTLVALPWLVLRLTGDSLVLGLVLALLGLPRALFILLGGAVVDRFTPHRVLMLSKHASTVLLGVLAWLVLADQLSLALVYALALGIGLASAFGIPAATSILPQAVAPHQLQAANGLLMGLRQLSFFVGPLLAGGLVAVLGEDSAGLGWAFALDALSFALSAFTLSKVRTQVPPPQAHAPVLAAVMEGLRCFWRDQALRTCLLYWAAVALLITGPVQIALPVLAHSRPAWGAAAFGSLLAAHGAGTLLGMLVSGLRPRWRVGNLGLTILLVDAIVGLLFMPMGVISALWQGMGLLLAIGVLGGYMQVTLFTWIQRRVAPALLGRAMSVFLFIFVGLAPLSSALTGWLLQWVPLATMFGVAGASLVGLVALAALGSPLRRVTDTPAMQA